MNRKENGGLQGRRELQIVASFRGSVRPLRRLQRAVVERRYVRRAVAHGCRKTRQLLRFREEFECSLDLLVALEADRVRGVIAVLRRDDLSAQSTCDVVPIVRLGKRITHCLLAHDLVVYGVLGKLLDDPALYDNLNQTMLNLAALSDQIKSGEGTLGKLFVDDRLYQELTMTVGNLNEITAKINAGEGSLGKLMHDDALYDNISDTMARINSIATKIDAGQGTLGKLINEDDVYRDAKTTLHKVEKSVDGISDTGPLSALGIVLGTLF